MCSTGILPEYVDKSANCRPYTRKFTLPGTVTRSLPSRKSALLVTNYHNNLRLRRSNSDLILPAL